MNTHEPLKFVVLLASSVPEEQHAYAKEFVTEDNRTGYLGKVVDIELKDGIHYITVKSTTFEGYAESLFITGEIMFEMPLEEMDYE